MENCSVFREEFNLSAKPFQYAEAGLINPSGRLIQSTGRFVCWYIVNPSQVKRLPRGVVVMCSYSLQRSGQNMGIECVEPVAFVGARHSLRNRISLVPAQSRFGATGPLAMSSNL